MFPLTEVRVGVEGGQPISLAGPALQAALQYLPTNGHPGLLQHLGHLQQHSHSPPVSTEIAVTPGSQDGLCKAIEVRSVLA